MWETWVIRTCCLLTCPGSWCKEQLYLFKQDFTKNAMSLFEKFNLNQFLVCLDLSVLLAYSSFKIRAAYCFVTLLNNVDCWFWQFYSVSYVRTLCIHRTHAFPSLWNLRNLSIYDHWDENWGWSLRWTLK